MKIGYLLLGLGLAGCKVGPNYQMPETDMPSVFSENPEKTAGSSEQNLCDWWSCWNDPVLESCIQDAVTGNFDIAVALEKILEARSYYRIESSYLGPTVDMIASATRSRFSQNIFTTSVNAESIAGGTNPGAPRGSVFGPAIQNFFQIGFDAVWELDIWGKLRRDRAAAFDAWEAVGMQARDVILTTIAETASTYVALRSLQGQIALLQRKIEVQKESVRLSHIRKESGIDGLIPVEARIAVLEQDSADLPVLQTSYKQTLYALAVLLGKTPESLDGVFCETRAIPLPSRPVPAGMPSDLLRRRPDIRAAERTLAAATEKIGVAVSGYFPQISLTGSGFGYESNRQNDWVVPSARYWSIGPNVQWNLLDFGRLRAQIALAKSQERQAFFSYEQTVIEALRDVEGALVAYFDEERRYKHLEAEKEASKVSYTLTKDLFSSGLSDEIQALEAEADFLDKEISCLQSLQAFAIDGIALYKAIGGDWECSPMP